jgi:serine/threonine-protein kinase
MELSSGRPGSILNVDMSDTEEVNRSETIAETDLSGRQLGGYRLLRRLGRGSMAEVYLAEQSSLRRKVAVKVLKSHLASDNTYVKRFHHEAQAAASLVHANIVQIHEVGYEGGVHFIAQEYVEGRNLKQQIVNKGTVDAAMGVTVMRQVAAALYKAGQHGIVHRDIKPENIMLARTGEVKVADFGLARLTDGDAALNLTQIGITMGTPLYMSPEQVEGRRLDPRSDIYSLGVTCYHMLAGVPPFRGDTALSVAVAHLKQQPERLETHRGDLPVGLCRIIHKMLAKDPSARYATARDLLRDLRDLNVEGLDDAWPDDLGSVQFDEIDEMRMARTEATQQLQTLMSAERDAMPRRHRLAWLAAACVAALLVGGALAMAAREPFLLGDVNTQHSGLKQEPSAAAQFLAAASIGTEAAWQSVEEHYPDVPYYVRRAKQNLARMYMGDAARQDDAIKEFRELAEIPGETEFRAFGLAGQVVVLTLQEKYRESSEIYLQLRPMMDAVQLDPEMQQMVDGAQSRNRVELGGIEAVMEEFRIWQELNPTANSPGT